MDEVDYCWFLTSLLAARSVYMHAVSLGPFLAGLVTVVNDLTCTADQSKSQERNGRK